MLKEISMADSLAQLTARAQAAENAVDGLARWNTFSPNCELILHHNLPFMFAKYASINGTGS